MWLQTKGLLGPPGARTGEWDPSLQRLEGGRPCGPLGSGLQLQSWEE